MYSTRRSATVNWGNTAVVSGAERQSLAMVQVETSQAQSIFVSARLRSPAINIVPMVTVEWGHGGATIKRDYPVVPQLSVCVAGSSIRVNGWMVNRVNGNPPLQTVQCDFSCVVAPGSIGRTDITRWITQRGASGQFVTTPTGVLTVGGYVQPLGQENPPRWLMLFDSNGSPGSGAPPLIALPMSPTAVSWSPRARAMPFENGVFWGLSQDPLQYSAATNVQAHVEVELSE